MRRRQLALQLRRCPSQLLERRGRGYLSLRPHARLVRVRVRVRARARARARFRVSVEGGRLNGRRPRGSRGVEGQRRPHLVRDVRVRVRVGVRVRVRVRVRVPVAAARSPCQSCRRRRMRKRARGHLVRVSVRV